MDGGGSSIPVEGGDGVGTGSSSELVDEALERIEALNGQLGAFVLTLREEARAEAATRDAEAAAGHVRGPLHGRPVAVKDLIDVAGAVTAAGSPKLEAHRADEDAEVVGRLRDAGMVIIGKTRTHEFAYGVATPGTVNPWEPGRIAGGSSGGSAAAVAAGIVDLAIGTDTAGSIRIPAACCGVTGFKPTYGAVPTSGVVPLSWSCDHVGPIASDVAEVSRLFGAMSGRPAAAPAGTPLASLRVGRIVGDEVALVDRAVDEVIDQLCGELRKAGSRVDDVELPLGTARAAVAKVVLSEMAVAHAGILAETGEQGYSPRILDAIGRGQKIMASEYITALRYRASFQVLVENLLGQRDALLLPTLPVVAPEHDSREIQLGDGRTVGLPEALTALPGAFNCSGSPVVSLPVGLVEGLPVGVSLVGRFGGDQELLQVAAAVEATAQFTRRPVLHA